MPWQTLLVLGGIGSGKDEYAEAVLAATAPTGDDGSADRLRRIPADTAGLTELAGGAGLTELAGILREAKPQECLLVEDLAGWLPADAGPDGQSAELASLLAAVRTCPARLVLVSSEVGHQTAPSTATDRQFIEAVGALNRAVATAVDAVVLVVAGLPSWLKGTPGGTARATLAAGPATDAQPGPDLSDFSGLPVPDEDARRTALSLLPGRGAGLGALAAVVEFAAGCRADPRPGPWRQVQLLAVHGDHQGAAGAGAPGSTARADALRAGTSPLAVLAGRAGAGIQIVETAPAEPIEAGPAMPAEQVDPALAEGWRLAEQAADDGTDLLILASIGDGAETAAAAVTTLLVPGTEPAGLVGRVLTDQGTIDDAAWISRVAAVRDAARRVRTAPRGSARLCLAELGGPDLAVATGLLIGAAARRVPVLLDGPFAAAAGLLARNLAPAARRWWLLPDPGGHPLVIRAAEALSLTPLLDLRLALGDGATALAALPVLQAALALRPAAAAGTPAATGPDQPGSDHDHSTPDQDPASGPS